MILAWVLAGWLAVLHGADTRAWNGYGPLQPGCHFRWQQRSAFGLIPLKRTTVVVCWQRDAIKE